MREHGRTGHHQRDSVPGTACLCQRSISVGGFCAAEQTVFPNGAAADMGGHPRVRLLPDIQHGEGRTGKNVGFRGGRRVRRVRGDCVRAVGDGSGRAARSGGAHIQQTHLRAQAAGRLLYQHPRIDAPRRTRLVADAMGGRGLERRRRGGKAAGGRSCVRYGDAAHGVVPADPPKPYILGRREGLGVHPSGVGGERHHRDGRRAGGDPLDGRDPGRHVPIDRVRTDADTHPALSDRGVGRHPARFVGLADVAGGAVVLLGVEGEDRSEERERGRRAASACGLGHQQSAVHKAGERLGQGGGVGAGVGPAARQRRIAASHRQAHVGATAGHTRESDGRTRIVVHRPRRPHGEARRPNRAGAASDRALRRVLDGDTPDAVVQIRCRVCRIVARPRDALDVIRHLHCRDAADCAEAAGGRESVRSRRVRQFVEDRTAGDGRAGVGQGRGCGGV